MKTLKLTILGAMTVTAFSACGGAGGMAESAESTPPAADSTTQSTVPAVVQTTVPMAKWGPESWKLMGKVSVEVNELTTTINAAKSRTQFLAAYESSRLKFEDLAEELYASDLAHAKDVAQHFLPDLVDALDDLIAATTSNDEDAVTVAWAKLDYLVKKWFEIRECTLIKTRDCV